jgi:hypothetical protein
MEAGSTGSVLQPVASDISDVETLGTTTRELLSLLLSLIYVTALSQLHELLSFDR